MKAHFTRRYRLSASHRLHCTGYSDERNRDVYGKCNNAHGHGHNYFVEVTVSGPVDRETGMVINMVELDAVVGQEVLDRFDHANLNADPAFRDEVPTTENFCRALFQLLRKRIGGAHLERVRVEETSNNFFEFAGEKAIG